VRRHADAYLQHVGSAREAYEAHGGRKVIVRYEDLRTDTLGTMMRMYSKLAVPVDEARLAQAVEKHSWENIPEEEKGQGKFYRKATPEAWREDLTRRQVKTVERITAPLLEEFYPTGPAEQQG
jgi:Sulfotransferase domain